MKRGFTLIEIIVITSIFLILGILVVSNFRYFQFQTSLKDDAESIINALRLAQNKTLASEGAANFGVHFENKSYILFINAYAATSTTNTIYNLSPKTEIFEINLNGGANEAIFNRVAGTTGQYGNIKLRLIDDLAQIKTVSVDASGQVFLGTGAEYSNPSARDSRHVHFTYNKGIKAALILNLNFPNDSFSYDINFQDYLNASKDEFIWQGTVAVNGQNQVLKIHTHFLTDTAAQFSIHRDRRYNNKALDIFLDGDNLISYTADGVITKGTSPFVTEPEIQ